MEEVARLWGWCFFVWYNVMNMDSDTGGQSTSEKQRQTAAELARRKVLESYRANPGNFEHQAEAVPKVDAEEWKKYHSAWQEYYQKYYGGYYGQAAKDYVEQTRLKLEREHVEQKSKLERQHAEQKAKMEEAKAVSALEAAIETEQEERRGQIRAKASSRARKIRKSKHFVPVIIGALVILVGLFFQYNQVIFANVAAYISPRGGEVSDISAIDPNVSSEVGPESVLIIPKLNVSVPIVFGAANDTVSMNNAMSNGVAHFSVPGASAMPGEIGNLVISGHSAGNVYRASDYKFIFSGLHRLTTGDLIHVNYDSTRYTYSVVEQMTVEPTNVGALVRNTEVPLLTLITCTPLGTSQYRLLVFAEQISPSSEGAATAEPLPGGVVDEGAQMPSGDPTPLEGLWNWLTGRD